MVFGVTAVIALGFLVWGFVSTATLASASGSALGWIMDNTGWLFALTASGFVVFVLWLALGKFGNIPLGCDDEEPEFRTISWVAMMFSAGMGIGLMFFGVAEPLTHFATPPPGTGAPGNPEAVQTAMATTLFHWTLHPWAIYAVVGLAIAYGVYRQRPDAVDQLRLRTAAWATAQTAWAARSSTCWRSSPRSSVRRPRSGSAPCRSAAACTSSPGSARRATRCSSSSSRSSPSRSCCRPFPVWHGAFSGCRISTWCSPSRWPLFVFVVGPTVFILNLLPTSLGSYFQDLAMMSARTGAEGADVDTWLQSWTIFYWAWWISWTPFVGMFIARISRGRTIRQFVTGVLLVPSVVSLVWFAVFGGAAIKVQQGGVDLAGEGSIEQQLFSLLDQYPIAIIASVLVMVLVAIFFVSGADAASIVMGSLSERGTIKPSRGTVIFWGIAMGAVALVMLLVGGEDALTGLQTITIIAALPFVLVMIGLAVALVKDLRSDPMMVRRRYASEAVDSAVVHGVKEHGDDFMISVEKDPDAGR